jgi:hypothetical protein
MAPWSRKKGKAKGRKDQLLERRNGRRRKATSLPAEVAAASRVGGDETETTTKSERNSPVIVGRPRRNSLLGAHSPFGPPTETEKRNNVAESTQNGSSAEERRGHRRQLAVSVSVEKLELLLTAMGEDVANTEPSAVDVAIAELEEFQEEEGEPEGEAPPPEKEKHGEQERKRSLTDVILKMLDDMEVGSGDKAVDLARASESLERETSPLKLKKLERQQSLTPIILKMLDGMLLDDGSDDPEFHNPEAPNDDDSDNSSPASPSQSRQYIHVDQRSLSLPKAAVSEPELPVAVEAQREEERPSSGRGPVREKLASRQLEVKNDVSDILAGLDGMTIGVGPRGSRPATLDVQREAEDLSSSSEDE